MILGKSYYGNIATDKIYLGSNLIYQLTPPTPFEDYYNLVVDFGTNDHVTFDQQPTWATNPPTDDFVHPSTLYFKNGWNGHNYWMYITGYADTQGVTENPYLFYSDDEGYTWQTPVGTPAPIHTYNSDGVTDTAHLSDTWIMMEGNTMHLFNRGNLNAGGTYWEYRSTTDGVNFTARQRITFSGVAASTDYVSASFILIDGTWYMFGTDVSSQEELAVLTSTSLSGTWTEINRIASDSGALWHTEVHYNPDDTNFYVLGSTGFISGGNLMFGKFSDVMAATMETRNTFLLPLNNQTWNVAYYKSSFIIKDNAMELFLGCKGAGVDSNTDWRVQKVTTSRLTPSLDLSGYNLVDTYDLPSVANGFTAGMKDLGYNKVALQFTFTDVSAFDVQVARLNTTSFFRLYMVGNTLYFRDWNTGADQPIVYGIAVGDVVTIIRDETNYTLYVNSNNVFQTTAPHTEDLGTLFGDFANSSSMSNLKVYMKPEWIFSKPIFEYRLSETFTDASVNTANYLIVDDFNRATLGTTDLNGTTYTIIGTPTINSDTILSTGGGNIIGLNHSETDYTIYVNPAQTDFNSGRVYFNYTDDNNCLYLEWQDGGIVNRFVEIVGGSTTYTTVDIVGQHSDYEKYILEVDDTILNIYADNVFVGSATIPTVASAKFAGIQTGYTSRYVDDFIVAKGLLPVLNLTAPTAPTNLIASNVTDVTLDLSWTASTNDSGISDYNIYNNDGLIASVGSNATSYTVTDLTASTLYNFTVRGVDNLGTESVNSNIETVTTEAPDTQDPTAPTNLVASNATNTTIDLTWTASTDNFGVVDYKIYNSDVLLATVGSAATSYQLTGLTEDTEYILTVRGLDLAGNESVNSNSQTISTLAPPTTSEIVTDFMTAAGIPNDATVYYGGTAQEVTGAEQWTALTTLVDAFKTNGTWDLHDAIYPLIGGTKSSIKWNLKSPLDTDAAYRLEIVEPASYHLAVDAFGVYNTAPSVYTSSFINTHYNPSINGELYNNNMSVYVQSINSATDRIMGVLVNNTDRFMLEKVSGTINGDFYNWGAGDRVSYTTSDAGMIAVSRTSSNDLRMFINGTQVDLETGTSQFPLPNGDVYMLAINGIVSPFRGKQSFATIGKGISAAQATADYAAIQAFQTALGRNL